MTTFEVPPTSPVLPSIDDLFHMPHGAKPPADSSPEHTEGHLVAVVSDSEFLNQIAIGSLVKASGIYLRGTAPTVDEALSLVTASKADILIIDPCSPSCVWSKRLSETLHKCPQLSIILMTRELHLEEILTAFEIGVRAVVSKTGTLRELELALLAVVEGNFWVPGSGTMRNIIKGIADLKFRIEQGSSSSKKNFGLTYRELEIVDAILDASSNPDLALKFSISEQTVKRHLGNIFDKTGVSTRRELALFAINHGLTNRYRAIA